MTDDRQPAGSPTDSRRYILQELLSGDQLQELARSHQIQLRGRTKAERAASAAQAISLEQIAQFCLEHWLPPPVDYHIANLKSGLLAGHSWHGAAPSRLHLSLQDRVRALTRGRGSLAEFLRIGTDIAKHEYFMVAVADLCEHALIVECGAFPAITSKALSDLVLDGVPYDVKNVSSARDWPVAKIAADPAGFAEQMIRGADSQRIRQQAEAVGDEAPFNRLFVVVQDETSWLVDPESVLRQLVEIVSRERSSISVEVDGVTAKVLVVAVS